MKELTWKEQIKEVMDTLIPYCGTANIEPRIEDIISIVEAQQQVSVEPEVKPEISGRYFDTSLNKMMIYNYELSRWETEN